MSRSQGNQKKSKTNKIDFTSVMKAKMAEKAQLEQNITETLAEIDRLKAQLKSNRASLKSVEKAITKLEMQKAEADKQAALEAQKVKLESAIQNLLDEGMSTDDIICKLNG